MVSNHKRSSAVHAPDPPQRLTGQDSLPNQGMGEQGAAALPVTLRLGSSIWAPRLVPAKSARIVSSSSRFGQPKHGESFLLGAAMRGQCSGVSSSTPPTDPHTPPPGWTADIQIPRGADRHRLPVPDQENLGCCWRQEQPIDIGDHG